MGGRLYCQLNLALYSCGGLRAAVAGANSRCRVVVEHRKSPSVRAGEFLAVLHDELDFRQVARHGVLDLRCLQGEFLIVEV